MSLADPGERRIYEGSLPCDADIAQRQSDWQHAAPDTVGMRDAAGAFLAAFDSLRWAPLAAAWANDATVFLPDADEPGLLVGRNAVLGYFEALFADVRAASSDATPTLGILPAVRGLHVQPLGPGTALITFHLGDGPEPGRRSVVWRRDDAGPWQIAHLHASRLSTR